MWSFRNFDVVRSFRSFGVTPVVGRGGSRKRKMVENSRDACEGVTFQKASSYSSILKKGRGGGSAKDKAARILADSEVETSGHLPPRIKRSFIERQYSPSTSMNWSEW
jgi:hypothetical protein